ncbi:hypothetical protein EW026_g8123 [Hermanssonia centrifuga]|uniref:NADH-ubiquinone oxidoreductase B15 subunit n=1 Tax=Hermanssonia centrifuga TaxID=98765 RepID=A0A4S4K5G7_9APHY|nr:hypothetical protein EW026_g8123 [Hermanssonia centrifuga]
MAGTYLKRDPAIDSFSLLRSSYYQRFRFTPKLAVTSIIGMIAVPAAVYYIAENQDRKWDWKGRKKGESLRAEPKPEA